MNHTKESTPGSRLKLIINELGKTTAQLSRELDIKKSYFSQMINGGRGISGTTISKLCNAYPQINVAFLTSGQGEIFLNKSERKISEAMEGNEDVVAEPPAAYKVPLVSMDVTALVSVIEAMQGEIAALRKEMSEIKGRLSALEDELN